MDSSDLLAAALLVLFVVGLVLVRLAFAASQLAVGAALGRFKIPRVWERWLFGELPRERHP
jgi:hypothetical protein